MTKEEKIQFCKYAIEKLENQVPYSMTGLCELFSNFKEWDYRTKIKDEIPELWKYKPPKRKRVMISCYEYWFYLDKEGIEKRIKILNKVLKCLK